MAVCTYCAKHIERLGQPITEMAVDDTWVIEGSITDDQLAGSVHCTAAPSGLHAPAPSVVVFWHGGQADCVVCQRPANYRVVNRFACANHLSNVVIPSMRGQRQP